MNDFIAALKVFVKNLFVEYSTPKEIETARDYRNAKKWVKKVSALYIGFTVFAVISAVAGIAILDLLIPSVGIIPKVIITVLCMPLFLLTNWGYATVITYFPEIIKSVFKAGKTGFEVGLNVETTHVQVSHEYGNTYSVSATTENKGFLFGYIAAVVQFIIWAFFCVYIGPFLTFKKIRKSIKNLKQYKDCHTV